ncbi:WYL domain-containing protein [Streptomyces achromogenes]|uniref:WYL domain-containing protein n=1 Tax=Streptomyces achromogenes TaxID=67255 RepID=UPI003A803C34
MRLTAKQPQTKTLADLYRAIDNARLITITYVDEKGEETVRSVEPWDIRTTKSGRIQLRAGCRLRGDARSFYIDQIASYTIHRMGFVLDRPEATTPAGKGIVVRSEQQLIARELGRDYLPRVTRQTTTLAA